MSGRTESRARPQRTCVGCRICTSKTELLRVVVIEGRLVPDPHGRLPGRGAYLHPEPECLVLAERRKAFARALRTGQRGVAGPLDVTDLHRYVEHRRAGGSDARGPARFGNESEAGRDADERSMSTQR